MNVPTARELIRDHEYEPCACDSSPDATRCLLTTRVDSVMSLDPLGWEQNTYADCLAKVKSMLNGER